MQDYQKIGTEYLGLIQSNPFYQLWEHQICNTIDLAVWFMLQSYFFFPYVVSKQDDWGKWISISSLNGLKGNICRPS
jgi:hypothetical protein